MAERSGPEAAEAAFNDMADALARYLEALGWTALVVSRPRIQKQLRARSHKFEFVVDFTAGPPTTQNVPRSTSETSGV